MFHLASGFLSDLFDGQRITYTTVCCGEKCEKGFIDIISSFFLSCRLGFFAKLYFKSPNLKEDTAFHDTKYIQLEPSQIFYKFVRRFFAFTHKSIKSFLASMVN